MYPTWDPARPYVYYSLIQGGAILTEDGNLIPVYGFDVSWSSLQTYLPLTYANGKFPILELFITNIAEVNDTTLANFMKRLSNIVGDHSLIFDFAWEYNFPADMEKWGFDPYTFYIPADVYNSKMHLVRTIIDTQKLTNIYLASHANMLMSIKIDGKWYDNPNFKGITEYLEGMRQADVVGFSHYNDYLSSSWNRAQNIYNLIGTGKPCLFFEYAPTSPWQTQLNVTGKFVDDSYTMLNSYPFIKGMIWYIGQYCTNETITAITQNAKTYDGR